jgi:hypothetical protein
MSRDRRRANTSLCKHSLEDQVATIFEESLVLEHAKGVITGNGEDDRLEKTITSSTPTRM